MKSIRVGVAPRMITLHSLSSWSWIPINLPLLARGASPITSISPSVCVHLGLQFHPWPREVTLKRAIQQENSEHHHKVGWGLLYIPVTWDDSCGWFLCGWPGCNFFQNYLFAHQKNVLALKSSTRIFKTLPPCNSSKAPHPPCLS